MIRLIKNFKNNFWKGKKNKTNIYCKYIYWNIYSNNQKKKYEKKINLSKYEKNKIIKIQWN